MEADTHQPYHKHCVACFNKFCQFDPVDEQLKHKQRNENRCKSNPFNKIDDETPQAEDCPMCTCSCGFRYHQCKQEEHELLCDLKLVPCINHVNGCIAVIQHRYMTKHLERCPANVVFCAMEWNRWPVYSKERQSRVPFIQNNLHARYGQLDVALALRDQRALNAALKVPKSTKRLLRNPLTPKFPAIPLVLHTTTISNEYLAEDGNLLSDMCTNGTDMSSTNETSHTVSDDDSDAPWAVNHSPPGLTKSIYKKLLTITQNVQTKTKNQDTDVNEPLRLLSIDISRSGIVPTDEYLVKKNCPEGIATVEDVVESQSQTSTPDDKLSVAASLDCDVALDQSENGNDLEVLCCQASDKAPELTCRSTNIPKSVENETSREKPPYISPPGPELNQILCLDLNVETLARFQAKPKSMYTFICAKELRRDQYIAHYNNLHMDIHCGLNGWLEQRCPLAQYGCTYSKARMHPNDCESRIVFSETIESFGVQSKAKQKSLTSPSNGTFSKDGTPEIYTSKDFNSAVKVHKAYKSHTAQSTATSQDNGSGMHASKKCSEIKVNGCDNDVLELCQMPVEVLLCIAEYLDNYSLYHLSLTNHLFRDVCRQLVHIKGIVVEQWQRVKRVKDGKHSWRVAYYKWMYTCAFDEIREWKFMQDQFHMSEHLKHCSYNTPSNSNCKPYALIPRNLSMSDQEIIQHLQNMYPTEDLSHYLHP